MPIFPAQNGKREGLTRRRNIVQKYSNLAFSATGMRAFAGSAPRPRRRNTALKSPGDCVRNVAKWPEKEAELF
tara:strand:- start:1885 stop:2103 length:219 start_codon:yes stop_codon:yes gene_type:complete